MTDLDTAPAPRRFRWLAWTLLLGALGGFALTLGSREVRRELYMAASPRLSDTNRKRLFEWTRSDPAWLPLLPELYSADSWLAAPIHEAMAGAAEDDLIAALPALLGRFEPGLYKIQRWSTAPMYQLPKDALRAQLEGGVQLREALRAFVADERNTMEARLEALDALLDAPPKSPSAQSRSQEWKADLIMRLRGGAVLSRLLQDSQLRLSSELRQRCYELFEHEDEAIAAGALERALAGSDLETAAWLLSWRATQEQRGACLRTLERYLEALINEPELGSRREGLERALIEVRVARGDSPQRLRQW